MYPKQDVVGRTFSKLTMRKKKKEKYIVKFAPEQNLFPNIFYQNKLKL